MKKRTSKIQIRFLFFSAFLLFCSQAFAATKYVDINSTVGGNGTTTATTGANRAYATITDGLAGIASGDTLQIAVGTYTEGGSTLMFTQEFSSTTTIQAASGATVIIRTGATNNAQFGQYWLVSNKMLIKNIIFDVASGVGKHGAFIMSSDVEFQGCTFSTVNGSSINMGVYLYGNAGTISNVKFTNCTFSSSHSGTNSDFAAGLYVVMAAGTSFDGINISGCTFSMTGSSNVSLLNNTMAMYFDVGSKAITNTAIINCTVNIGLLPLGAATYSYSTVVTGTTGQHTGMSIASTNMTSPQCPCIINHVTGIAITNSNFVGGSSYGLSMGSDATGTSGTVSGTVSGSYIYSYTNHALLVGYTCNGVTVDSSIVLAGNHGAVYKHCANCILQNSVLMAGKPGTTITCAYQKGASSSSFLNNTILATGTADAIQVGVGDSSTPSSNPTVTGNSIICTGSSHAYNIASASSGDVSGAVTFDQNKFTIKDSATYGLIRATTGIASLPALKAAWNTFSPSYAANDAKSYVPGPGGGGSLAVGGGIKKIGQ